MLVLEGVTFSWPDYPQRYRFEMRAGPGEVTAISGESGSGKSTLLDLIAGFLTPTGGAIRLDGHDLVPLPPEKRPVSILFQSDTLFDHLSAARNVALGLPPGLTRSETTARVSTALQEVGLAGIESQRAATLSGGQKQRVALARTLLRARPVLLLDEPFSALDDETRAATRALVGELTTRHGWITVLVSHHLDDIRSLAARHYRLAEGVLTSLKNGE